MRMTRPQNSETSVLAQRQLNLPCKPFHDAAPLPSKSGETGRFKGTENPRHLRAIRALMTRPMPREHLDRAVGCSNAPELVAELRRRGLAAPCEKVSDIDRDGLPIKRGVYYFTEHDRLIVNRWLASRRRD